MYPSSLDRCCIADGPCLLQSLKAVYNQVRFLNKESEMVIQITRKWRRAELTTNALPREFVPHVLLLQPVLLSFD